MGEILLEYLGGSKIIRRVFLSEEGGRRSRVQEGDVTTEAEVGMMRLLVGGGGWVGRSQGM